MKFARGRPLRDLTVANTPEGPACADAQGRVCRLRRQTSCANPKVKARTGSGQSPIPLLLLRPKGLEPPTPGSEDRCSIQLSYGRMRTQGLNGLEFGVLVEANTSLTGRLPQANSDERVAFALGGATGFEPATPRTTTWCANRLRHAPHVGMSDCTTVTSVQSSEQYSEGE